MKTFFSRSAAETRRFAAKFAKSLRGDKVILLTGDLGSGKTEFVKGLARSLGVRSKITSPTFLLHKIYDFKKAKKNWSLHHLDLYRLSKKTKLESLGLREILREKSSIVAIEWPGRVGGLRKFMKKKTAVINFMHGPDSNSRKIKVS